MSAIKWSEIATYCGQSIGSQFRDVFKISNLGFYVLFVPNGERSRIERDLAFADLPILGHADWTREDGEQFFLAVVKAESPDKLRAIAYEKGKSEAGAVGK